MATLLFLIPALPLAAAILTPLAGPVLRQKSHLPTVLALVGSFLCSAALLKQVIEEAAIEARPLGYEATFDLWTWAAVASTGGDSATTQSTASDFSVVVTLRADTLTAVMLVTVTFVASLVAIYAAGYMEGDRGYWRFFSYVALFVFSMTMLVAVSNFVLLFVFWEAVGLCSYLLIGFWYQKPEAAAAGKKAFLVNRVGDFGFMLGLFLIWTTYGTLNFHDTDAAGRSLQVAAVEEPGARADAAGRVVPGVLGKTRLANRDYVGVGDAPAQQEQLALAICLLLLLGACGKSAQFPLHVWLPDAMEGPTPVSALIHAATMVTAGVYMVTRCMPLFAASEQALAVVATVGAFTALLAGIIALTQTDLKRILAYSTISQLGYMFLGLGTGSLAGIGAGMFHLFTHAFFKALLFLGAGSVMHAMGGVIDVRRFGGLRRLMPVTHGTFLVGALALAGVFPLAGFFSKDLIIHAVEEHGHEGGLYFYLYWAARITAVLTAFYTFRAFFLTFYGEEEIPPEAGHHAHESPAPMTAPLLVLAVCAAGAGVFNAGGAFFRLLGRTPSLRYLGEVDYHPIGFAAGFSATALALAGIGLAAFLYLGSRREVEWLSLALRPLYLLSHGKFFFDPIYNGFIVWPLRGVAWLAAQVDRYVIDGAVNLVGRVPLGTGRLLRTTQTGLVQFYAMLMVVGLLVLVSVVVWGWL